MNKFFDLQKIKEQIKIRDWFIFVLLVVIFVLIRLPGTSSPLHQDEYKWPQIVNPANQGSGIIPHPPFSELVYRVVGMIVGYNVHFRFVPLFFGTINLILLFYFLDFRFNRKTALIGSIIFTLSYFSVLASLMVDVDGQILPFLFLLSVISYYKSLVSRGQNRIIWLIVLALSLFTGFFIKLSFLLVAVAIAGDYLLENKRIIEKKDLLKYFGYAIGILVLLSGSIVVSPKIFPLFNLGASLSYWKHFANISRNWFQTGIQVVKVILYLSPFLVCIPFFLSKPKMKEVRPFLFYILFGLIFFTILFDFSIGALDRYLQFLIIPLCVISAVVIESVFKSDNGKRNKEYLIYGILFSIVLLLTLFVSHFVPSLHPKSAWISRILSFKWNFLYPFSGGSGPIGFYVSFLFMALAWLVSVALVIIGMVKLHLQKVVILILIPIGFLYNSVFTEEYLLGRLYGSAPRLLTPAVEYIKNNPDIKKVVVYNDNGGAEVMEIGKYERRLYADPAFENNYKDFFKTYSGYILYIDIPRIDSSTFYSSYFDSCKNIYKEQDKYITAKVLDCKK